MLSLHSFIYIKDILIVTLKKLFGKNMFLCVSRPGFIVSGIIKFNYPFNYMLEKKKKDKGG